MRHFLGADASAFLATANGEAARLHAGPGARQKIDETLKFLREKAGLEAVPGAPFSIGEMISSNAAGFPGCEMIPRPVLLFDPSGTRKDEWSERGLKEHGPYDQRTFSPKQLRIAVVCQAKHEGRVDAFLAKFLDGIPAPSSSSRRIPRYGDGFVRRFALGKPSVTFFTASGPKAADYAVASREALARANDDGFMWDLAFVQVEEAFKREDDATNPYFTTKSIFLKLGVPVQSVRLETMSQPDSQLAFSMNHMSLATYAKLRGTPWLLASQQTVAHELVIGLGSHTVFGSRIGTGRRFVGITTVFSSDGSYLLSDRTAVVPFDDYAAALYETLKRAITTVRKQDNWRSTDKVRLVFHMFKPPTPGFPAVLRQALADRGRWLAGQRLATVSSLGEVAPKPDMMRSLRQRETAQLAETLSRQLNAIHVPHEPGSRISGVYERAITTPTGRLAVIRSADTFTLAPWKPALEPLRGRAVLGVVGPNRVMWTLDRGRALPGRG